VAAECLRDSDIGDSSLSLSDDLYRNEPRRPGTDGSSSRQAAVSPAPVVLLPRDPVLDVPAAFSNPIASKLHHTTTWQTRWYSRQSVDRNVFDGKVYFWNKWFLKLYLMSSWPRPWPTPSGL